jgi:glucokinase
MEKSSNDLALGIDLGGTKILTAVVNTKGEIISKDHSITPASRGKEAVLQSIQKSAERVIRHAGITLEDITAVGVGAPGPSNPDTGILFASPNLPGWSDVPLGDIIEKKLGVRSFIINDANAAAFGEFYFGAARSVCNFIYITISTGIGGGIFIEKKLYTGSVGTAAEIGHMTINDKGPLCKCGNKGCWEAFASGTALAKEAKKRVKGGAMTSMLEYVDNDTEKIDAHVVNMAAEKGDTLAKDLISNTGYYLGVGFANLINLFNPERIVIGGGLSSIGEPLISVAKKVAEERSYKVAFQALDFVYAELGRDSGVLGASACALQNIRDLAQNI